MSSNSDFSVYSKLHQEDKEDKVETGLGCLKVANKLSVHKSLQIFNSWQQTIFSLIINDSTEIFKVHIKQMKSDKDVQTWARCNI